MRVRKITESKKLHEQSDGWDLEDFYELKEVLFKIERLKYELKNCVRGAYTHCETYKQLSNYIVQLANELEDVGYAIQDGDDVDG